VTLRRILVVEDGNEYVEAFRRLAPSPAGVQLLHAADAAEARRVIAAGPVDAVFLDLVFDRTLPGKLTGDFGALLERFSGDRSRALEHLARNQGFYIAEDLAPRLPPGVPVLLACDFSSEPARLSALRERIPALDGVADGATATEILARLLAAPVRQQGGRSK
jgi:CheY-like chemotaxis protein